MRLYQDKMLKLCKTRGDCCNSSAGFLLWKSICC